LRQAVTGYKPTTGIVYYGQIE